MLGCLYLRLGVLYQFREGRELHVLRVTTTEAPNQRRQRTAWDYYDIFIWIGFGSYLRVTREVIFSPVMGDWLIHRDNSSVEYNVGSPTKFSPTKSRSSLLWVCSQWILTAVKSRHFRDLHPL